MTNNTNIIAPDDFFMGNYHHSLFVCERRTSQVDFDRARIGGSTVAANFSRGCAFQKGQALVGFEPMIRMDDYEVGEKKPFNRIFSIGGGCPFQLGDF